MTPLKIIIEVLFALLILLTPFAFGSVPLWAYTFMELALLLIIFLWVIRMVFEGELAIPKSPLNISILLFVLLVVIQIIPLPEALLNIISPATGRFYSDTLGALGAGHSVSLTNTLSLNTYATRVELFRLFAYLGCFFFVIGNFTATAQIRRLIIVIIVTGFLLALFAIVQHLTWNGLIYWVYEYPMGGNPVGPFTNKNNFAGYMNMIIPLSLIMSIYERDKAIKIIFAFMALVMTVALFLSMSRAGVFTFMGSMLFMASMLFITRRSHAQRLLFLAPVLLLFFVILFLVFVGIDPVIERLSTLGDKATYSRELRWTVWASTIEIIKDYPLFGTGLESFETVFPGYRSLEAAGLHWRDAHNDYLQLLAETGIIGFLIVCSFFVIFFMRSVRTLLLHERDDCRFALGPLASVVALLLSIIFTFNTHIPANALLFSVICALVVSLTMVDRRDSIIE